MKIKNSLQQGFTLVELLIVIALIGVLATALVATLDPIEQINKARDARFKNDAAELLAAIERYYASTQQYPWVTAGLSTCGSGGATACTNGTEFGASGQDAGVGVCSGGDCSTSGYLITSGELKSSFAKKDQFSTTQAIDRLYLRRTSTGNAVYVCFIPKAGTNRESATLTTICNSSPSGGDDCDGFTDPATSCSDPGSSANWDDPESACFICVPEVGSTGVGST